MLQAFAVRPGKRSDFRIKRTAPQIKTPTAAAVKIAVVVDEYASPATVAGMPTAAINGIAQHAAQSETPMIGSEASLDSFKVISLFRFEGQGLAASHI